MDPLYITLLSSIAALVVGLIAGKIVFSKDTKKRVEEAETQAQQIIDSANLTAETIKKEKILEAKERFVQLKAEHDRKVLDSNKKISEIENRIRQREIGINQKESGLDRQIKDNESIKENLNRQIEVVTHKRNELEKHQEEHIRRLEKIAGLTAEEAKHQLIESLKQEAQTQALSLQQEIIEECSP